MRAWTVAGALIVGDSGLLLVGNRRRDGSLDWTPPGGVIDPGETLLEGLAREVNEETGLVVTEWGARGYGVTVDAPEMGWAMRAETWIATATGDIALGDPDGIVEQACFVAGSACEQLLTASPLWIREPVTTWMSSPGEVFEFTYRVTGSDRRTAQVERTA